MTMRQLVCVVIVMAIAGIAIAQTIIIEPSDDMYSDPEHPGAHPSDELWVANYDPTGNYQRIMMKFDLDEYLGQEIDSGISTDFLVVHRANRQIQIFMTSPPPGMNHLGSRTPTFLIALLCGQIMFSAQMVGTE